MLAGAGEKVGQIHAKATVLALVGAEANGAEHGLSGNGHVAVEIGLVRAAKVNEIDLSGELMVTEFCP